MLKGSSSYEEILDVNEARLKPRGQHHRLIHYLLLAYIKLPRNEMSVASFKRRSGRLGRYWLRCNA